MQKELPSNCHHHVGSKQHKEIRVRFLSPIQERWREILKIFKKKQKSKSSPRYLLAEGPWTWLFIFLSYSFLICKISRNIYSNITWEAEVSLWLVAHQSSQPGHFTFLSLAPLSFSIRPHQKSNAACVSKRKLFVKVEPKKTLSSRVYLTSRVK